MTDAQRVNGYEVSWGDIYVKVGEERFYGIAEIAYGDKRARSKSYGMGRSHAPRGRTAGKYEVDPCTMKMLKKTSKELRTYLASKAADGKSYGSVSFQIVVQYADANEEVQTDTLHDCVIDGDANSHSEGPDPLYDNISVDVMRIDRGDLTLYDKSEGPA
jgi:hypothetical protein